MQSARILVGCVAVLIGHAQAADELLASDALARKLDPYLMKPLPSIEALAGVAMADPAPLMVVASFGNDDTVPDLDRGFAVGYTLNELLFDANPKLDVVPPWFYVDDTAQKDAPRGMVRDSTANAYRAGGRDHAQWCVHGKVTGASPTHVELTVDGCAPGQASHKKQWEVRTDDDWPGVLAEMCEYALANAAGEVTAPGRASCQRAQSSRPASFLAFARYGGPKENRSWSALEAMYKSDPQFAPAAIEYLHWLYYTEAGKSAFWARIGEVANGVKQSSAAQLMAYSRTMPIAWNIKFEIYKNFFAWLRTHSQLSSAWLVVASSLSAGNILDYPPTRHPLRVMLDRLLTPLGIYVASDSVPNEATHTAALAISFAVYRVWPDSYRSLMQMGYGLERYGFMLRGSDYWHNVPATGRDGFRVMISWADGFNHATLERNSDSGTAWNNLMNTAAYGGDDWVPIFDKAAEVVPWRRQLYYDAMTHALDQWGGDHALREYVQTTAIAKNPGAEWPKTLVEYYEKHSNQSR